MSNTNLPTVNLVFWNSKAYRRDINSEQHEPHLQLPEFSETVKRIAVIKTASNMNLTTVTLVFWYINKYRRDINSEQHEPHYSYSSFLEQ